MNVAEIKQVLSSCWHLEARLQTEYMTLERLRAAAAKSTPSYSLTSGGGGDGQKIENCVLRIVEMEAKSRATLSSLFEAKAKALAYIDMLPEARLRMLMQKRYVNYDKWEQIAVDMNCSYRRVHQLHSKALLYLANNT